MTGDEPLEEPCRRCGADLRWVRACEQQAERALATAQAAFERGDALEARRWARRAVRLVDTSEARGMLEASAALTGGGSLDS